MDDSNLHELFVLMLRDMYDAENQIIETLPSIISSSSNLDLKDALTKHLEETKEQVTRLDEVGVILGDDLTGRESKAMTALLEDADEIMSMEFPSEVIDAAIIGSAQKVEHFEIAAYGTLITWAKLMEHNDIADLLKENLNEEEKADKKLSQVAEGGVNEQAMHPSI